MKWYCCDGCGREVSGVSDITIQFLDHKKMDDVQSFVTEASLCEMCHEKFPKARLAALEALSATFLGELSK